MLVDGNFLYTFQKDLINNVQSWECHLRRRHVCKARVKVLNDQIIERVNQHTHAPNSTKVQTTKIRVAMKRRAETTINAPQRILSEGLAQATPAVAVNLPRIPHIRRAIRRHRKNEGDPANPVDRASIPRGGGTRIRNDGYVRPEIGGLENDPYGDSWRHEMRPLQRPNRKF